MSKRIIFERYGPTEYGSGFAPDYIRTRPHSCGRNCPQHLNKSGFAAAKLLLQDIFTQQEEGIDLTRTS